jgi:hypothetical protein
MPRKRISFRPIRSRTYCLRYERLFVFAANVMNFLTSASANQLRYLSVTSSSVSSLSKNRFETISTALFTVFQILLHRFSRAGRDRCWDTEAGSGPFSICLLRTFPLILFLVLAQMLPQPLNQQRFPIAWPIPPMPPVIVDVEKHALQSRISP